jgi:DNA-binding transcriptional LysR family regulator
LIAVRRAGSLAEAARRLGVPRTSLMRRIDELEASLGVPLIHRLPEGVVLTASGERLVDRGQALLDAADELGASIREDYEIQGTLRVAYPSGLHPGLLASSARVLMQALPGLRFQGLPGARLTEPNAADVGVHIGHQPPPGPWVARVLTRVPVRLLAGSAYVSERGLPATVEELDQHTLFFWTTSEDGPTLPLVGGGSLPVRPRFMSGDLHFLHTAARAGLGIAYAVDGGVEEPAGTERLTPVLPDLVGTIVPIWLLLPEATRNAPRIRDAIAYLEQLVSLAGTALPGRS